MAMVELQSGVRVIYLAIPRRFASISVGHRYLKWAANSNVSQRKVGSDPIFTKTLFLLFL
jgi:hypothetical protein